MHLENQQNTVFEENNAEQAVLDGPRPTELTAYFDLNARVNVTAEARDLANTLLYHDIPQHFIFKNKQWVKRKRPVSEKIKSAWTRNKPIIGRIHNVSQKDAELYALRLLLLHVKGAKSYRALRTVDVHTLNEDGTSRIEKKVCDTFKEAAILSGLLQDDLEWEMCLTDAEVDHMPSQLRSMFASILIHCNPT